MGRLKKMWVDVSYLLYIISNFESLETPLNDITENRSYNKLRKCLGIRFSEKILELLKKFFVKLFEKVFSKMLLLGFEKWWHHLKRLEKKNIMGFFI